MALNGMQIYKILPKKNCKECGVPTCLAFAMKVAQGKIEAGKCPYLSDDAKSQLSDATAPPMRTVKFGAGDKEYKLGGETVLFRHEKTFVSKPRFAVMFSDKDDESKVDVKIDHINKVDYNRINEQMFVEVAAVKYESGNADKYLDLLKKVINKCEKCVPMLIVEDADVAEKALALCADKGPILFGANDQNYEQMVKIAKDKKLLLGVKSNNIESLYELVQKIQNLGYKELLLDSGSRKLKDVFADTVNIRRTALLSQDRTFGYPSVVYANEISKDPMKQLAAASLFVAKYGSIIVLDDMDYYSALPLYSMRQNIFTDPQRPMRMEPGLYKIGNADENSPLFCTVDFALTYFLVSGEIERSKVPCWLLISDAGGYSVLTSWAAGKFSGKSIAKAVKDFDVENKLKTRKIVIPGKVAVLKPDVEDELPGWEAIVGTEEAALIPKFMKETLKL